MNELLIKQENEIILKPEIAQKIADFEKQAKAIKTAQDRLKEQILAEMEALNLIKLDTPELSITYIAPTYRETFDSKALQKDDEKTYNKYIKLSDVKASVRIKVK